MSAQISAASTPAEVVAEWRPDRRTARTWRFFAVPLTVIGTVAYVLVASGGAFPAGGSIGLSQIVAVLALTVGLFCLHEGVHGLFMFAFGARPRFGVTTMGGILVLYTTAPGYRFTRPQFIAIALAPLALLVPLGLFACLLPFGGYLVVPFAIHLPGCVGDMGIAWHLLRGPSNVLVEDLPDGMRLLRAAS